MSITIYKSAYQSDINVDYDLISAVGPSQTFANAMVTVSDDVGKTTRITDVGPVGCGSLWISDGVRLRPLNGRALHCSASGTLAAPLATVTGAPGKLVLPAGDRVSGGSILLPVGLPLIGQGIGVEAKLRHRGTGGTWTAVCRCGTSDSSSDNSMVNQTGAATDNQDLIMDQDMEVVTATSFIAATFLTPNSPSAGGLSLKTTNFNNASQLYVSFYVSTLNAADSVDLISYRVYLNG